MLLADGHPHYSIMTRSLRRQSARNRLRQHTLESLIQRRALAVELFTKGKKYREVMRLTGLSSGTVSRIKKKMSEEHSAETIASSVRPRGATTTLTEAEEKLIVQGLLDCSARGFAADNYDLKQIAARVAKQSNKSFKNDLPSDDWTRAFRARHENLTYRKHESRSFVKLAAETADHLQGYVRALRQVESNNPGIFDDPRYVWNMDETDVSAAQGERLRVFGPSQTNNGGIRGTSGDGGGRHLTAVVIANAAGDVLPPFFIFAGVKKMQRWFEPLPSDLFKDECGGAHWMTAEWMPPGSFIIGTKNGSMEQGIIHFVIEHMHRHARKIVPNTRKALLLLLDGHASRGGAEWLERGVEKKIEIVQAPANTSHFIQPCDDRINKTFKRTVRKTRDALCKTTWVECADMRIKMMLGVAGYRSLTPEVVRKSFKATKMWPMDYSFVEHARDYTPTESTEVSADQKRIDKSNLNSILQILHGDDNTQTKMQDIGNIVHRNVNINATVAACVEPRSMVKTDEKKSMIAIEAGVPALYLTHSELIASRKVRDAERQKAAAAKAHRAALKAAKAAKAVLSSTASASSAQPPPTARKKASKKKKVTKTKGARGPATPPKPTQNLCLPAAPASGVQARSESVSMLAGPLAADAGGGQRILDRPALLGILEGSVPVPAEATMVSEEAAHVLMSMAAEVPVVPHQPELVIQESVGDQEILEDPLHSIFTVKF